MLVNTGLAQRRSAAGLCCVVLMFARGGIASWATEYEVEGSIHQTITERNGFREDTTSEFIVSVRHCGWLIQAFERNPKGNLYRREVGSTNGMEIFELVTHLSSAPEQKPTSPATAVIISNNIPVGFLDQSIVGHLWLMFASQCYWSTLKSDMLTPVYDWKACAGANPDLKARAEWTLLSGPGSLPRQVAYLGQWDETNGLYTVTETTLAGQTIVPKRFVFEERHAVAMHGMELRKRVEAEVSGVRSVCSRTSLLPTPTGRTVTVDFRLVRDPNAAQLPTYQNPAVGRWASVEEARKLAPAVASANSPRENLSSRHRRSVLRVLLCSVLLLGPVMMFYSWRGGRNTLRGK